MDQVLAAAKGYSCTMCSKGFRHARNGLSTPYRLDCSNTYVEGRVTSQGHNNNKTSAYMRPQVFDVSYFVEEANFCNEL